MSPATSSQRTTPHPVHNTLMVDVDRLAEFVDGLSGRVVGHRKLLARRAILRDVRSAWRSEMQLKRLPLWIPVQKMGHGDTGEGGGAT